MRHYFLLSLCLAMLVVGCKKESDTVFDQTPDERLNKTLSEFQAKLIGGQYGWIGTLEPKTGTSFYFYFMFKPDNRVQMLSDYSVTTGTVLKESSYRLKALQQPTLIFDTYSYIHMLADPDPAVAGGDAGKGLYSDFEFAYDPTVAKQDTITVFGRFNGAKLTLVRATKEQQDAYLGGALARAFDFHKISALSTYVYQGKQESWGVGGEIPNYWKRFTVGGTSYEVDEGTFSPLDRSIRFSWYVSGQKQSFTTSYHFGAGKVVLDKPFTAGSTVINEFTNLKWDANAKTLTANLNSTNTTTTFAGATSPIVYDTTQFTAFRNRSITSADYWIADYGFQKDGVFNSFGIDTITSNSATGAYTYYQLLYWADYGALSGQRFDLFAPVFLNPAQTGVALRYAYAAYNASPGSPIVSNGIANFSAGAAVTFGTGITTPATGGWTQTQSLFRATTGYYFIRLPDGNYDQVAVSDAKSWLAWHW